MSDFSANNQERYFSLEEDFMNYKVDDLLYGYLFYHTSNVDVQVGWEKKKKFYLRIKDYNKMRKDLKKLLDVDTKTLKRHMDLLENNGLIWKETMKINKNEEEVYIFKSDDFIGYYQKVNYGMLEYLIQTGSKQKIKIYIYLLEKYQWKRRESKKYIFTKKEILEMLGYKANNTSSTNANYGMVSANLDSLYREGAILFETVKIKCNMEDGRELPVEMIKLEYVAEKVEDLRPVPKTK